MSEARKQGEETRRGLERRDEQMRGNKERRQGEEMKRQGK